MKTLGLALVLVGIMYLVIPRKTLLERFHGAKR